MKTLNVTVLSNILSHPLFFQVLNAKQLCTGNLLFLYFPISCDLWIMNPVTINLDNLTSTNSMSSQINCRRRGGLRDRWQTYVYKRSRQLRCSVWPLSSLPSKNSHIYIVSENVRFWSPLSYTKLNLHLYNFLTCIAWSIYKNALDISLSWLNQQFL